MEPAGLQLLFPGPPDVPAEALQAALREYHPSLADAVVSPGTVSWGVHVVRMLFYPEPMPREALEACLNPALLPPELKAEARAHGGHVLLYYAGEAAEPLEQLVAVGAVAGAMSRFGAILTLNEEARTAIHAIALLPDDPGEDMLATLRSLPVPYLWGGYAKFELSDTPGVWIRTFANPRLGIPNLAHWVPSHDEGERIFHLFAAVAGYLRETGLRFEPGEVVRIDDATHLKVREPHAREWWLEGGGPMLVLDAVLLEV